MAAVLEALRGVAWYVGELMGDHDYARYCEHLRLHHPDEPVPTEREYWRRRHADEAANPGARCC
ncbi:YbdD/YjiX family protein [Corynebacterium sp.]|uniref:YbdD/YjiX family protein n=1 Tax=Corynebacterium sp. TaxID=1720 RepID=UPI0026DDBF1B|nr:YbdD/YjiX family protein [Corynebacterium sp.]MDO4609282.1 YbdD/YjiX family protein [Corynebacterium sp.]